MGRYEGYVHNFVQLDYLAIVLDGPIIALTCRKDRAMLGSNPSALQGSAGDS